MSLLDRTFQIRERGSTVGREILGGITTFMALSYIIFVQPAIMAEAGIPMAAAFIGTCVASAIACVIMGFLANYPIALAPAMGHNAYFTYIVVLAWGYTWQQALTAVFVGGAIFVLLSFFGFRSKVMEFIPDSLKRGIAGGIGLLITFIGLQYAGIVVGSHATGIRFGNIHSPYTLLSLFGLAATLALMAAGVRGAVLWGILATTLVGIVLTLSGATLLDLTLRGYQSLNPQGAFFALDFAGLFRAKGFLTVIFTFLFLDVFDCIGTLIGVGERGQQSFCCPSCFTRSWPLLLPLTNTLKAASP
jgi:AGZA family xanthine/uracil permease-like MFS transporter